MNLENFDTNIGMKKRRQRKKAWRGIEPQN